ISPPRFQLLILVLELPAQRMEAQLGLDSRAQDFGIDWLDHEIVGASSKTGHFTFAMSGQHNDWNLRQRGIWIRAQSPKRFRTIHFRHFEIKKEHGGRLFMDKF